MREKESKKVKPEKAGLKYIAILKRKNLQF
jgi:hypothetical protein